MGRHSPTPDPLSGDNILLPDWRADWLASARRGDNPLVMAKLRSGYAVFGDTQHLPGYSLLLSDVDDADHLNDLTPPQQSDFLADMALLGQAVFSACSGWDPAFRRLNYEILGNSLPRLHAHVHARYASEPAEFRLSPVARYSDAERYAPEHDAIDSPRAEEFDALREAITKELIRLSKV
jgi:diadenosine tetraphosphate (Ap4A) HIT family hydrolase